MDDRTTSLVSALHNPEVCAQLTLSPSPYFFSTLKTAIQQNSRAWLRRYVVHFMTLCSLLLSSSSFLLTSKSSCALCKHHMI